MKVYYNAPNYIFVLYDNGGDVVRFRQRENVLEAGLLADVSEIDLRKRIKLSRPKEGEIGRDILEPTTLPPGADFNGAEVIEFRIGDSHYDEFSRFGIEVIDYRLKETRGTITIQDGETPF